MSRPWYKTLTALLWLAPAANALRYRQVWYRLPNLMASHFNAAGQANGWSTRQISLYYSVGSLALVAGIFSVVLVAVQRKYGLTKLGWVLLIFFHAEIWTLVYLLDSILEYNLGATPVSVLPLPIVTLIGTVTVVTVAFAEKRGKPLAVTDVVAEEVHSGRSWGALFLVFLCFLAIMVFLIPVPTARVVFGVVGVIMASAFAMAWDGFHYYFSRHGVEIRTLGFRLKSIPLLQIKGYEIQSWNPLRGMGIRGMGDRKAYVWGRSGVRVEMYEGEVFLGHDDPQRIVHDLNVISGINFRSTKF